MDLETDLWQLKQLEVRIDSSAAGSFRTFLFISVLSLDSSLRYLTFSNTSRGFISSYFESPSSESETVIV